MKFSKASKAMMAKTDTETGEAWLPLWMHLSDTAGVMGKLIDHWLPPSTMLAIGLSEDLLKKTGIFLAAIHDIGKATALFQSRITVQMPGIRERLQSAGIRLSVPGTFIDASQSPHALAGEIILCSFGCPAGAAAVVGAHHGKPQKMPRMPLEELIGDQLNDIYWMNYFGPEDNRNWEASWKEWINFALGYSGFSSLQDIPKLTMPAQILLTGLVITADWIASNPYYFPLIPLDSSGSESFYPQRLNQAMERLAFPELWSPANPMAETEQFHKEFGFPPNDLQRAVIHLMENLEKPGILIIEAQMGVGKTEAALAAAEIMAAECGSGGIFFGLPTQATANGIFARLESWAKCQSETAVHAIRLAHGAAELNEDYRKLFRGTSKVQEDSENGGLIVHNWFEGRKQALLADFVIGTVDQLLLAAIKQKHVMLRHLGLAGKVVIVDECHSYDAYMNQYLDMALTWLGAYGVPVILLSATLPAGRRTELVEAYLNRKGLPESDEMRLRGGYPLLTWSSGGKVCQKTVKADGKPHTVQIEHLREECLTDFLKGKLSGGGCACVILNTVRRAQSFAEQLKLEIPDAEVLLIHAQYIMPDRAELEKTLLRRMGKKSMPEMRNRLIVVGTQVLEQSLDYDCDLLITDLCPMDLLLQRIGRLHRHPRGRPESLKQACCAVLETPDGAPEKSSVKIYSEWLLLDTQRRLPEQITIPEDIPLLVRSVYEDTALPEDSEKLRKAEKKYREMRESQKRKAEACRLPGPPGSGSETDESLDGWLDGSVDLSDQNAVASVRDGDPSVDVLVMVRNEAGTVRFLPWQNGGAAVPTDCIPSEEEAKQIARQRIRLPSVLCHQWTADRTIRELENINRRYLAEWQQSHFLKGELALLLDEKLTASLCGYQLHYSQETGLACEKEEENDEPD